MKKSKKLPKIKCPSCKKTISRDDLRYSQEGNMTYTLSFDKYDCPIYDHDEFNSNESGEFFHDDWNCPQEALSLDDLRKLKINY